MRQEFQPIGRLEEENETGAVAPALLTLRQKAARDRANAHLSRFAPILYALQTEDPAECRNAIATIQQLRQEEVATLAELETFAQPEDTELVSTLRTAIQQSELVESQLRQRLSYLQPGAPEGAVNLAALRETLAEVAAKKELAEATGVEYAEEDRIETVISQPNWGGALGIGIFGLGWTAFTTFHAFFMIGGMWRAFGPAALFMLLFYAIFFTVGFGMLAGAVLALSQETLELEGDTLQVHYKIAGIQWHRAIQLGPNSRAGLATAQIRSKGQMATDIVMVDAQGKEYRFGRNSPEHMKQSHVNRINAYIKRYFRRAA